MASTTVSWSSRWSRGRHPSLATRAPPRALAGAALLPRRAHGRRRGRPSLPRALDGASSGGSGDSGSIDELAALLAKRAAELRAESGDGLLLPEEDEEEGEGDAARGAAAGGGDGAAAAPVPAYTPPVAMPPHDDGFHVMELQVFKTLGQLGVASRDGSQEASPLAQQPVFVYAARYVSNLPFEGPATVLLKEYQAASVAVAANEALVQQRLLGPVPERKWQAAVADATPHPPVVQLLGWLGAPPSDAAYEITGDNADATWLVYRFEGLKPLSVLLPGLSPPQPPPGLSSLLFGGREAAAEAAVAARFRLLRTFAARLLGALSFCHSRGVAHCCLGPGSVQCSGLDDKAADRLIVKLDNWGLARLYPGPLEGGGGGGGGSDGKGSSGSGGGFELEADSDAAAQRRTDLQSAALLLVEVFAAGSAGGPAAAALGGGEALRRLLFEVFHEQLSEFRHYCEADEGLASFVDFCDATRAWGLLGDLLQGDVPAGELLRSSSFFMDGGSGGGGGDRR